MIVSTPFSLEDAPPLPTEPAAGTATPPPLCPAYAAVSADRPLSETPLFADSFAGGALPVWSADGAWMLEDGALTTSTESSAVHAAVSEPLADLVLRLTLRVESGAAGVAFRRSAFGLYRLLWSADGVLTLERAGTLLCAAPLPGSMREARSVYVRAAGGRITAALDGVIVLDVFDPAALPAGGVALTVDPFSHAAFDDVTVSRLSERSDTPMPTATPFAAEATEEPTAEAVSETPAPLPDEIASTTSDILYDFTQGAFGFAAWGAGTPPQPTAGQGWYGGLTGRTTGNINGLAIRLVSSVPVTVLAWSADIYTTNGWSMALFVDGVGACSLCGYNSTGNIQTGWIAGAARTGRLIEVHLYNHHGVQYSGASAATYILRRLRIRYQVQPTPTPTPTPTPVVMTYTVETFDISNIEMPDFNPDLTAALDGSAFPLYTVPNDSRFLCTREAATRANCVRYALSALQAGYQRQTGHGPRLWDILLTVYDGEFASILQILPPEGRERRIIDEAFVRTFMDPQSGGCRYSSGSGTITCTEHSLITWLSDVHSMYSKVIVPNASGLPGQARVDFARLLGFSLGKQTELLSLIETRFTDYGFAYRDSMPFNRDSGIYQWDADLLALFHPYNPHAEAWYTGVGSTVPSNWGNTSLPPGTTSHPPNPNRPLQVIYHTWAAGGGSPDINHRPETPTCTLLFVVSETDGRLTNLTLCGQ
jgi:hypothetical protein